MEVLSGINRNETLEIHWTNIDGKFIWCDIIISKDTIFIMHNDLNIWYLIWIY